MKKDLFLFLILSAVCIFTYACGNDDIETDSSIPIIESSSTVTSTTKISRLEIKSTASDTTSPSSDNNTTVTTVSASENITSSTTLKTHSGETEFVPITGQHAQYEARVPSVLKPYEPVIYTTAPPETSEVTETTTTETTTATESETEETTTTLTPPEPFNSNEMYYNGIKPGDDATEFIESLGEFESMSTLPSDYYIDDVQAEECSYFFSNLEVMTYRTENVEILREIIIKDSSYSTSRGISIGMTSSDIISAYGTGESDGINYIYYSEFGDEYIYFTTENDIINYIGYRKIFQ